MGRCGRERAPCESVVAYRRWCLSQVHGGQASTHGRCERLALSILRTPDVSHRHPGKPRLIPSACPSRFRCRRDGWPRTSNAADGSGSSAKSKATRSNPACDNTTHTCKTIIIEVHQDYVGHKRLKIVFDAPAGVRLIGRPSGVELEAGGADHHVHAHSEGPEAFSCEWYAKKRPFGDNGLAKGYCEAEFSDTVR